MSNKWIVYKHTSPNNKVYIGITCKKPERRWDNGNGYKYNKYFYNSILKYGWDSFEHEILFTGLDKERACVLEIKLISRYRSNKFKYGFNQSKGGQGGRYGIPFTEEEKAKHSKPVVCLNNGKKYKSIKKAADDLSIGSTSICQCLNGKRITAKGYRFKYLFEDNSLIRSRYIPHNAKPIIEIDSGMEFESTSKASEYYNISKSCITAVLIGRTSQTHGYKFRYKDGDYMFKPGEQKGKVSVVNVNTGDKFDSIMEASRKYSVSDRMISACCKGLIDNVSGYKWKYTG